MLQDDATVFVRPVPSVFQELIAAEVGLFDALFGQLAHHFSLCGDTCMVGSRHPAGIFAFHTGAANENILNRIVQHVAHVEHTRYVWRRNDHRIRFAAIGFATEEFIVEPVFIPFRLHGLWVILTCKFHYSYRFVSILRANLQIII